jgi:hypothetical protein
MGKNLEQVAYCGCKNQVVDLTAQINIDLRKSLRKTARFGGNDERAFTS